MDDLRSFALTIDLPDDESACKRITDMGSPRGSIVIDGLNYLSNTHRPSDALCFLRLCDEL